MNEQRTTRPRHLIAIWAGLAAVLVAAASSGVAHAQVPTRTNNALTQILGRATDRSISLNVLSPTTVDAYVEYGTKNGSFPNRSRSLRISQGVPATFTLTGLSVDRGYLYRVRSKPVGQRSFVAGATHRFHTQRAPGSPFTFTIDADPHNRDPRFNGELYATTLTNARSNAPDFHINLGDTFMTEKVKASTYAEAESTFTDMRPYLGIIGADAALYLVNGNHEAELGWLTKSPNQQDLPLWATKLRQTYYPNPTPDSFYTGASVSDPLTGGARDAYFAWTWGDALFVTLDPFWYTTDKPKSDGGTNWNWTLGRDQYNWFKTTLENSRAKFKFVFIHHLVGGTPGEARGGVEVAGLYEWGGNNADGTPGFAEHRPGWAAPIHQLLVANHVNAVFHGHDHVFVKQDLDGIVYQEVPQPSNAQYDKTSLAADYGYTHGDVLGSSGHLKVTVTPTKATVEYVRAYLPQDERSGRKNAATDYSYVIG